MPQDARDNALPGSVPDEAKGELAKAYVILKPGAEVSRADPMKFLQQNNLRVRIGLREGPSRRRTGA